MLSKEKAAVVAAALGEGSIITMGQGDNGRIESRWESLVVKEGTQGLKDLSQSVDRDSSLRIFRDLSLSD